MTTPTNNEPTTSATLLATWLSVSLRQAQRLIKQYRAVYSGDDLTQAEADHLMRARTHAARANISLEDAFKLTETATGAPEGEVQTPPGLPLELTHAQGPELFSKLMTYLESHGKYYAAWEARLQRQETELRGVRDEVQVIRTQINGLTGGIQTQQVRIQNQVAASLRRNHKKGVRA
jgi:hypothetical protein